MFIYDKNFQKGTKRVKFPPSDRGIYEITGI